MSVRRIHLERIRAAPESIDPVFLGSPQFECEPLSAVLGVRITLKVETLNPIRSFKGRGSELFTARDAGPEPLVCASAGNFGQAMAFSCRARSVPLTVFASESANVLKVERMRSLGAEVRLEGGDFDAAKLAAKRHAEERGLRMVEDAREVATAEGAGTIALELVEAGTAFDTALVPLGNGALLAGFATVLKALRPRVRIVAVGARGAPAMIESLDSGRFVSHDAVDTIADGIGVRVPVPEALDDLAGLVDDTVLVDDATIIEAMRLVHRHSGIVAEPSAVAGVAALLAEPDRYRGAAAATVVCGGNLTPDQVGSWLCGPD